VLIDLHGLNLTGMGNLMFGIASSISRGLQRDHQITAAAPGRPAFLADPRAAFEAMLRDIVWPALGNDHLVLMMDEVIRLDEEVKAGHLERDIFEISGTSCSAAWTQELASGSCAPSGNSRANFLAAAAADNLASTSKNSFVTMWNRIASRYGLPLYQGNQL
jgi:hypothetical protein